MSKRVKIFLKVLAITVGAGIAAFGLEAFMMPNGIIDGGVVGISMMISHLTSFPTSAFIIILNIPFLIFGYGHGGRKFVFYSVYAIVIFSIFLFILPHIEPTHEAFLACIFGGLILGIGVGIIIRFGGSLDGTEMLAISISKKAEFSVGQFVMVCNVVIFGVAAFVFGNIDSALYSMVAYFIASKVIDIVVEGMDQSKAAMIITDKHEEIVAAIRDELDRTATYLEGEKAYSGSGTKVVYAVVTRVEVGKLKEIIRNVDKKAYVTITNVADVISK